MSVLFALAAATLVAVAPASAAAQNAGPDSVTRVINRLPLTAAKFSVLNEKDEAALLLLDSTIVLQMTDRGLQKLRKDVKRETAKEPNLLGKLIGSLVGGTVITMLDHGIEYSLRDLKDARVENGVLVLENKAGERIFESVQINDSKVLETFSEAEARRFAKRVNAVRKSL
jgi:hypothetical protein